MIQFLVDNPLFVILLCLGLGYLFGKINLGKFPNNATLGTLYAAIIMNIIITSNGGHFAGSSVAVMKNLFFALFTFVLGYESGPVFKNSVKASGISSSLKLVGLSLFYCACVLGCAFALCKIFGFSPSQASGFLAGSQTQSTILNGESNVVAYAITYILATIGLITFVQEGAPAITKVHLAQSVAEKIDSTLKGSKSKAAEALKVNVQIRAYRIDASSTYIDKTISELTSEYRGRLHIEEVYRHDKIIDVNPKLSVQYSDIIIVAGQIKDIDRFNKNGLTEVTDEKYLDLEITKVDVVIAVEKIDNLLEKFAEYGIIVNRIRRNGRKISMPDIFIEEDVITVTGKTKSIEECIENVGFVKTIGEDSDLPALLLSIALAIALGLIEIPGLGFSLGTSCCSLIIGMIIGCSFESFPIAGQMSGGARWILKSLGLNLFIAATALERPLSLDGLLNFDNIYIVIAGTLSVFVPAALAVAFGFFILKLSAADLYGGICGCATSTTALNSLTDKTNSTIFTVGYTPAFVTSNICLTLTGTLLLSML